MKLNSPCEQLQQHLHKLGSSVKEPGGSGGRRCQSPLGGDSRADGPPQAGILFTAIIRKAPRWALLITLERHWGLVMGTEEQQ